MQKKEKEIKSCDDITEKNFLVLFYFLFIFFSSFLFHFFSFLCSSSLFFPPFFPSFQSVIRAPLRRLRQLPVGRGAHLCPQVDEDLLERVGSAPVGEDVEVPRVDLFFWKIFEIFSRFFLFRLKRSGVRETRTQKKRPSQSVKNSLLTVPSAETHVILIFVMKRRDGGCAANVGVVVFFFVTKKMRW